MQITERLLRKAGNLLGNQFTWLPRDFYHYRMRIGLHFLGTEPQQIMDTIEYYITQRRLDNWDVPGSDEIKKVDDYKVTLVNFPMADLNAFVDAEVARGVTLHVNANCYSRVKRMATWYQDLKRGSLYKVQASTLYFLPEHVMKGMARYDWSVHDAAVSNFNSKELSDKLVPGNPCKQ